MIVKNLKKYFTFEIQILDDTVSLDLTINVKLQFIILIDGVRETKHNRRTKKINKKINKTPNFSWFDQLCLRPQSCRDFTILENNTRYYMFRWLLNLLYNKIRLSPKT